jgi:hypothetical protein
MQFNNPILTKNMTTLLSRKSIGRSPLRLGLPRVQRIWLIRGFLLIPLAFVCFALAPAARALLPPPAPDEGYPVGNTAGGNNALSNLTTGQYNTANGVNALLANTTGNSNTANGSQALRNNTGSNNIGLGYNAGSNLTTGGGNVCIGQGVLGIAGESNTTRIKNVYASVASDRAVYVNSDNKIGTLVSSRRFKDEIKLMDKASETILALKPVTFRYKKEIEPNGAIMFGLIAEEVEQVDPDLVTRDAKGEAETVRYEAVNAMLLNEFLKEHKKVEEQQASIAQLKSTVAQQQKGMEVLTAQLEQQAAQIQKVSAQLEASKPAPQVVNNP